MKMFFYYSQYANNIHFHKLGFALSLVLKLTYFETRKWPIFCTLRAEVSLFHGFLIAFTKSFAWLFCRVVGLFTPRERGQTNYATDKPRERLRKH